MKYSRRILLIAALTAAALVLAAALTAAQGEDMVFSLLSPDGGWALYSLDDDMKAALLWEADNMIVYEDGTAYAVNESRQGWTLTAADVETGEERVLAGVENAPGGNIGASRLRVADGCVWYSVSLYDPESSRVTGNRIVACDTQTLSVRTYEPPSLNGFGFFEAAEGKLFYTDDESFLPMVFDTKTGEERVLCAEPALSWWTMFYDGGRFWYMGCDGDPDAYFRGESEEMPDFYIVGASAEDGSVTKVPFRWENDSNFWVHDGYVYAFRDRRMGEDGLMVADLYRTHADTQTESLVCEGIPYNDNFPPDMSFGRNGIFVMDSVLSAGEYEEIFYYIHYDGRGAEPVTMPDRR